MRFFLIDRVDELTAGSAARGIKVISLTDETLWDHFPAQPVFPGSLLIEAAAQLGGLLAEVSYHSDNTDTRRAIVMQVDNAKFHQPCKPGDQLIVQAQLQSLLSAAARVQCTVQRESKLAAQVTLTYRLITVNDAALHENRVALYRLWTAHWQTPPQFR